MFSPTSTSMLGDLKFKHQGGHSHLSVKVSRRSSDLGLRLKPVQEAYDFHGCFKLVCLDTMSMVCSKGCRYYSFTTSVSSLTHAHWARSPSLRARSCWEGNVQVELDLPATCGSIGGIHFGSNPPCIQTLHGMEAPNTLCHLVPSSHAHHLFVNRFKTS